MLFSQRANASNRIFKPLLAQSRYLQTRRVHLAHLPALPDCNIETFKHRAFVPGQPVLFPQGSFARSLPAIESWFSNNSGQDQGLSTQVPVQLDIDRLISFDGTIVPLEVTTTDVHGTTSFERTEAPLSIFLSHISNLQSTSNSTITSTNMRIYLAQCPLPTLPSDLITSALPAPDYVTKAGKGDIYDSSIWLGMAPTHTPLHRDPNPNLFVQLAGRKVVRVFEPAIGRELFAQAGSSGTRLGEEMMAGEGRAALDAVVWDNLAVVNPQEEGNHDSVVVGYEAVLDAGDGIFIPKGWWHSIKGVGDGIVGSVNWWFR